MGILWGCQDLLFWEMVIRYRDAEQNLFAKEPEIKKAIKGIELQIAMMCQRHEDKRVRMEKKRGELEERQKTVLKNLTHKRDGLNPLDLQMKKISD